MTEQKATPMAVVAKTPKEIDAPYGAILAGALATVFGGIAVFASAPVAPSLFVGLSGVLLICTGLIQRAIFLYR